ncbi:RNA exonuclease 1 homolog [Rhinophrynus dorsalis]
MELFAKAFLSGTTKAGKNVQELERINKAIEAVKNEVEEKQKKLLLYKNVTHEIEKSAVPPSDSNSNISTCPDNMKQTTALKMSNIASDASSKKCSNSVRSKKYVIDRSCPATDLEYDPLLNYSSSLFGSAVKESDNSKSKHSKCDEDFEAVPHKKPRAASPVRLVIKLQVSDDEDVLVIDVPPLQTTLKKQRLNKFNTGEEKSVSDELKEVDKTSVVNTTESIESVDACESPEMESEPAVDSNEMCSISSTSGTVNDGHIFDHDYSVDSAGINADSMCSQLLEQKESDPEPKNNISIKCDEDIEPQVELEGIAKSKSDWPEKELPVLSENPLKQNQYFGNVQDLEIVGNIPPSFSTFEQGAAMSEVTNAISEKKCQQEATSSEKDLIVLDSSSDEMDESEADLDISDSDDPMEECLRIFNEFAESETQKEKQAYQAQSERNINEGRESDTVTSQRKRIARPSAKCDIKSSRNILVPYRGPAQQQIPRARILHVQQQAVQIAAAVKSGQAFVASSQNRTTGFISPAFHNFGQMVCVNLAVQPVIQSRSHISGFFQGSTLATQTLKTSIPKKRTIQTTPVKISGRRKPSVVSESSSKVPHETRQRYVNSFVAEFLKNSATVQEAFDKALREEKSIYDRCGSKNMYLNIAVNSLKKLRDQQNVPNGSVQSGLKKNTSGLKKRDDKNELSGINLYNLLKEYLLSDEQLQENGYPRPNPEKPGSALLHNGVTKTVGRDALRRVCCRCGEIYSVTVQGKHVRKEECTYHSGRVLKHRVPGGIETRYSCCEAVVGTPGCQMAKLHVHDGQRENLDGFTKTFIKLQPSDGNPGIFSVDCEMCYTTYGLELTRVTVVDPSLQVVYDAYVKPENEIIDYNTRFSGVTEDNLTNITTSIRDVQAVMLNMFSADTILIGHGLENDLIALKLFHDTVVDTSVVFPHRLGFPHKRALRNLMADYLRRIIQDDVGGHNSSEDAAACMELMLWKVKEDTKGRR